MSKRYVMSDNYYDEYSEEELREELQSIDMILKSTVDESCKLKKQVKILKGACEFYKDNNKIRATKDKHLNHVALKALKESQAVDDENK